MPNLIELLQLGFVRAKKDSSGNPTLVDSRGVVVSKVGPIAELMRRLRIAESKGALPAPASPVVVAQVSGNWTPVATAAGAYAEQIFVVSAMQPGDIPVGVVPPSALDPNMTVRAFRWISNTSVGVTFVNSGGAAITAPAGTWALNVARFSGGLPLDTPLVTLSAQGAATGMGASIKTFKASDTANLRMRCPWQFHPSMAGGSTYATNASVTTPENPPLTKFGYILGVEFMTDAPKMELLTSSFGAPIQVMVDGKIVTAAPIATAYKQDIGYRLTIDFTQGGAVTTGVRKARRIRVEWGSQAHFGGLIVTNADSVWTPTASNNLRGMVFGDSFSAGTQSQNTLLGFSRETYNGFANRVGDLLGWDETFTSGFPSTGYLRTVNTGSGTGVKFGDRMSDIISQNPDVVLVVGSINDQTFTPAQLQAEVTNFYTTLSAALPNSVIFVTGLQNPKDSYNIGSWNTAVKNGVAAVNAPNVFFIDMSSWVSGTGNVGNVKNDGNADVITGADATHPSMEGYNFYTHKLAAAIRNIVKAYTV